MQLYFFIFFFRTKDISVLIVSKVSMYHYYNYKWPIALHRYLAFYDIYIYDILRHFVF